MVVQNQEQREIQLIEEQEITLSFLKIEIENLYQDKLINKVMQNLVKFEAAAAQYENLITTLSSLELQNHYRVRLENITKPFESQILLYKWVQKQIGICQEIIQQPDGWNIEKKSSVFSLSYKKVNNSNLVTLKVDATLDVPINHLASLIYEIDLYKEWFPFVKESKNLKLVDRATKVAHILLDIPMIPMREAFVYGLGVDRMDENGDLVVLSKTIDTDYEIQQELGVDVPKKAAHTRLEMPYFSMIITPHSLSRISIQFLGNFDAKVSLVPDFVINTISRKFGSYLFEKILQKSKNFKNSKWQERVNQNRDFYSWIERRQEEIFKERFP